jgi:hypothetical protein
LGPFCGQRRPPLLHMLSWLAYSLVRRRLARCTTVLLTTKLSYLVHSSELKLIRCVVLFLSVSSPSSTLMKLSRELINQTTTAAF